MKKTKVTQFLFGILLLILLNKSHLEIGAIKNCNKNNYYKKALDNFEQALIVKHFSECYIVEIEYSKYQSSMSNDNLMR